MKILRHFWMFIVATVCNAAVADVYKMDSTAAYCVSVVEQIGEHCGDVNSHAVKLKNICSETFRMAYGITRNDGKIDHGIAFEFKPGDERYNYVCKGTGEAYVKTCAVGGSCRIDD